MPSDPDYTGTNGLDLNEDFTNSQLLTSNAKQPTIRARMTDDTPYRVDKGWARLSNMVREYDEAKIRDVKEDIDTLLVFAGLFSAVLTAFIIETYHKLQEDSGDTSTQVLIQISAQLASLAAVGTTINSTAPSYTSQSFSPLPSFVRINTLWSCSLVISLITASCGILVKQWLHEYITQDTQAALPGLRIRFFRNEGLVKWRVFELAAALPLLLQIALLLFFIGLSEFLRQLNPIVGWVTTGTILAWLIVFIFTTVTPMLSSQCPYKTPLLKRPLKYLRIVINAAKEVIVNSSRFPLVIPALVLLSIPSSHAEELADKLGDIWDTLKNWKSSPLPEELEVRQATDSDLAIIFSSESLFLDEQLKETIGECSDIIQLSTIGEYCKEVLGSDGTPQTADVDSWRVTLGPEAEERVKEVVGTVLVYKSRNSSAEAGWPDVLRSILTDGQVGPWWKQLPILFAQLIQADVQWGAGPVFLMLYSSATQISFGRSLMYELCSSGTKGDMVDNLLSITRLVGEHLDLWPRSSGSTSANSHLRELIIKYGIQKDLYTFTYTFSVLLLLASPKAIKARKEEVRQLTSEILDVLARETDPLRDATWTTYWLLDYAVDALREIGNRHVIWADEDLITKLEDIRDILLRPL